MPMPSEMGYVFTLPQKTGILTDLNNLLTVLNGIKVVQLDAEERQAARSISDERYPYVEKLFTNLVDAYPNLQPPFLDLATAKSDFQMMKDLREILSVMKEVNDRYIDFSMASENMAFKYLLEFYNTAKRAQGSNTPGGDVCVEELGPLFEGQGVQTPTPPTE